MSRLLSIILSLFCPFINPMILGGWRSQRSLQRRRKQSRWNPLLIVMLSLWLVLLCSTTPTSSPTMVDNHFSGENPEEIYSGAFAQRILVGVENASPRRRMLISPLNLSAPVVPLDDAVSLFFSRSLHWKNCSTLLWCERGTISRSFISDLALVDCFCGSAQEDKSLQALMAILFVDSRKSLQRSGVTLFSAERDPFPPPPFQRREQSLGGSELSPQILAAVHNGESLISLSFIDFIDQRHNFGSGKFLWLQHGNVGSESRCLNLLLAFSDSIEKLIVMSVDVKVKRPVLPNLYHSYLHSIVLGAQHTCFMSSCFTLSTFVRPACVCGIQHLTWRHKLKHPRMIDSEVLTFLSGAIFGVSPNVSSVTHHQSPTPTRASTTSILSLCWNLSELEDCSPLAFSTPRKASQTSSCRGHERSFSTFLRFVGVTTSIKGSLPEKDPCLGYIANDHCRFPYRLIPCVMVRLGPEGTTILTPVRIEVMERSTSRYTVTITIEEFEGWCNLVRGFIVCGIFHHSSNVSSLSKLVSLSLYCLVLNIFIRIAHRVSNVAFIFVKD